VGEKSANRRRGKRVVEKGAVGRRAGEKSERVMNEAQAVSLKKKGGREEFRELG